MKVTKSYIKRLIKEELDIVMREGMSKQYYFKDRFSPGGVYKITKDGEDIEVLDVRGSMPNLMKVITVAQPNQREAYQILSKAMKGDAQAIEQAKTMIADQIRQDPSDVEFA